MKTLRSLAKASLRGIAALVVLPAFASFRVRSVFLGRDRALEGSSQILSLVPGLTGQYLRRAFYRLTLAACHPTATIEFGTLLSKADSRLDENAYVGPHCHLGWVHLERDVLVGPGVSIPRGPPIPGTRDTRIPIREQPGEVRLVRIGAGSWIGTGAVVMADVGRESIVAAGAVVTRPIPEEVVAGGVPARVLRARERLPWTPGMTGRTA